MADEWFVAQDTFNADLPGGGQVTVVKGSTWHGSHHVVALDDGRNHLFRPQQSADAGQAPEPRRSRSRGRSVPAAAAGAQVPAASGAETGAWPGDDS